MRWYGAYSERVYFDGRRSERSAGKRTAGAPRGHAALERKRKFA
jgi:hypothetical protein